MADDPSGEYPKALYKGDVDPTAYNHSIEAITVHSKEEEERARKAGHATVHELAAKAKPSA